MTLKGITKTCPNCKAEMPVNLGFITWCDRCNYNLEDTIELNEQKPTGMFPRLWAWMSKRSGERIYQQAVRAGSDLRPRPTITLVLAFGLALLVHGFTLLLVVTAATWLFWGVRDWGRVMGILTFGRFIGAPLLLAVAWKVHPHLGKLEAGAVRREQATIQGLGPLFNLADRVAEALGAPRVQAISITPGFTAAIGQVGYKREGELMLGLPLLVTLDRQELVGLVGHELAHTVNGDPQRTWLIGSAIHTLMEWADLFFIDRIIVTGAGTVGCLNLLLQLGLRLLSSLAWLAGFLMALLIYPNMQRAEYRADGIAARLAGTSSLLGLTRKLYLSQAVSNIFVKARHNPGTHILQEIRERMCAVPEREWLRIDRVIEKGESRLEDTHPTTKDRIALLRSRQMEMGQASLSMAEFGQIMEGLKRFDAPVEERIQKAIRKP